MTGIHLLDGDVTTCWTCRECSAPFVPASAGNVYCSRRCADKKRLRDPHRIETNRIRNRAWHVARGRVSGHQPWLAGEPPHGAHMAGAGFELDVMPHPKWPVLHRNLRALHGMVTDIIGVGHDMGGPGEQRQPVFSLVPWPRGIGWAVYCTSAELAALVAGKTLKGRRLYDMTVTVRCGPMVRPRAPSVPKRGHRLVRVDAITPVCTRNTGGRFYHTKPTAEHVRNALVRHLAPRLGMRVDDALVCVEIAEDATRAESVEIGQKWGSVTGWVGHVVLDCNAVTEWLLRAAAQGPGLGGRTGLGFGRVRVETC